MNMQTKTSGLGGIIRKSDGDVLISFGYGINFSMPVVVAEAKALRRMIVLCLSLGLTRVIFKGDCHQRHPGG